MFNEEEHVFIIEQPDQMEGAKTCCTAQSEVPNYHGAAESGDTVALAGRNIIRLLNCLCKSPFGPEGLIQHSNAGITISTLVTKQGHHLAIVCRYVAGLLRHC